MSDRALLMREIETLPSSCWEEALDFVRYIKWKERKAMEKAAEMMAEEYAADPELTAWTEPLSALEELKRRAAEKTARRKADGVNPFEGLYGVFKNSATFGGDPLEIVRSLRDEWDTGGR
jgi:hypothetical protein